MILSLFLGRKQAVGPFEDLEGHAAQKGVWRNRLIDSGYLLIVPALGGLGLSDHVFSRITAAGLAIHGRMTATKRALERLRKRGDGIPADQRDSCSAHLFRIPDGPHNSRKV